ncbi:MAG: insecticidal delta-endotoxin Cry8Ea1 family protein [Candidatus Scalindua sp.]
MTSPKIELKTWDNRLRTMTLNIAEKIPQAGGLISFTISIIWEAEKKSIWDLVKEQTKEMVDKAIIKHELEQIKAGISTLKAAMVLYRDAAMKNRAGKMDAAILQAIRVREKINESKNRHFMIPQGIIIAFLHLQLLREVIEHGAEYYEVNSQAKWRKKINQVCRQYNEWIRDLALDWQGWRNSFIRINIGTEPGGFLGLSDEPTGECIDILRNRTTDFKRNLKGATSSVSSAEIKRRMNAAFDLFTSLARVELASMLAPIWEISKILPNPDDVKSFCLPGFQTNQVGVISSSTTGVHWTAPFETDDHDVDGEIVEVRMRTGSIIDCLQFNYKKRKGMIIGNPKGGKKEKTFKIKTPINQVRLSCDDNNIREFEFTCIDGVKGGARFKPSPRDVIIKLPPCFKLVSNRNTIAYHYGNKGVGALSLKFVYDPNQFGKYFSKTFRK